MSFVYLFKWQEVGNGIMDVYGRLDVVEAKFL